MELSNVFELSRSGVFVISDSVQNKIYVNYSKDVLGAVSRLRGELEVAADLKGLSVRIVSLVSDIETLKIHTQYYREVLHKDSGYLIPYTRSTLQYIARIRPDADFKRVNVELVNTRGENKIVGKFKNDREANEFLETYYRTANSFNLPVYAANSATKEFLLDNQTKLLDIK